MILSCGIAANTSEAFAGIAFLLGLAALITGIIGMGRTLPLWNIRVARSRFARAGAGRATFGAFCGCLALIVALLIPTLGRAREPANRIKCSSHLRQIGQALRQYAIDDVREGKFPPDFETLLANSDLVAEVFLCPSSDSWDGSQPLDITTHASYLYLGAGLSDSVGASVVNAIEFEDNHNGEGAHVLYADGSVEFLPWPEVARKLAEQKQRDPSKLDGSR